jgi:hypothetical protein
MHKYTGKHHASELRWHDRLGSVVGLLTGEDEARSPSSCNNADHKKAAHTPASAAASAPTTGASGGTARCGAADGMNPGSCGYSGPFPGGVLPIWMYAPGGGGQFDPG